jgi:hypothetical protein
MSRIVGLDASELAVRASAADARGAASAAGARPRTARWTVLVSGAFCMVASVVASSLFLPHQSFWNDEATQMSGLSLSPANQVRWLAGRVHFDFGVGEDRMPPLSYFAGWVWSRLFGLTEARMRSMGVAAVGIATLLVFLTANRAWGLCSGVAAGLLFGLSPNVVVQAVEIRAYPLFLLESAAVFYCLTRYLDDPASHWSSWLGGLVACGVAAMYTHFFGLVVVGAATFAAMVLVARRGGRIWPLVLAAGALAFFGVGLAPFVFASVDLSGSGGVQKGGGIIRLGRFAYRLIAHPATSVSRVAVITALAGGIVASLGALAPKRRSPIATTALLMALATGALVVGVAHFVQSKFAAAQPSYNVWMLPGLSLWLASGLASASRSARFVSLLGVCLLTGSEIYATGQLAVNGDFFAHGPHRAVEIQIRRYGPDRVTLIHDQESGPIWDIYAPVRYEFAGVVRQFALAPGTPGKLRVADYPDRRHDTDPLTFSTEYLLVVRSTTLGAAELVEQVRHGVVSRGDGPVASALKGDGRWSLESEASYPTFVQADIDIFRRARASSQPDRR